MRSTFNIDDDLMRTIRRIALQRDLSLKEFINHLLRLGLDKLDQPQQERYQAPSFRLGQAHFDANKALAAALAFEDEEISRKLMVGK